MGEFILENVLSGSEVTTRDGRQVIIAGYNPEGEDFEKLLGWIKDDNGWYSQSWFDTGTTISDKETMDDLQMK